MSATERPENGGNQRVFGRHARLRTHAHIARMKQDGRTAARRTCVVAALAPPPDGARRVGFIVSRKYSPKAVGRNRARRVLREAYRQLCPHLTPAWIALIPRARLRGAKTDEVLLDLRRACAELDLLLEAPKSAAVEPSP